MIADYANVKDQMSKRTVLATIGKYRLVHSTAGYECAGSCARSTNEKWGVLFDVGGCPNGQWFKTHDEAISCLQKWGTP